MTKKILLLASYADSLILFRGPLMEKLVESGLEVHAAAPNLFESSEAYKEVCKLGVVPHEYPLSRTGMNPFKDLMTLFRLYFLMRSIKPDIVLSYTIKPIVYGSFAAYMSGVNRIYALVTGLGYAFIDHSNEIKRRFVRYLLESFYCYSLLRVKVIFFQNSDDEFLFRERKLIESTARTCVVNGSGVDLSFFKESPPCISPIRFLLIARFLGDKGIREYFQAAKIIKSKYPDVIFSLVGWSDTNPNAIPQKELDDWVGQNVIDLIGKLEDVRDIISTCSVYVLPSYREGTPRTVLEAMACGRAIITTDAVGCRETVVNGENGYLVPVKDVISLASAMTCFIESPELIKTMGRQSRIIAECKYDVNKVNSIMLKEMEIG